MRTVSDALLQQMTERLVAELDPDAVFLFGSRAWGIPREDSDVDLLVVMDADTERLAGYELRARRCLRDLRVAKDILVRSRGQIERYRHVPASLEAQVLTHGRLLYANSAGGTGAELVHPVS